MSFKLKKKFSLVELLASIIFFIFFVVFLSELLSTILIKRQQIVNNLQRMNINTVLNLNHGSLVCYYSNIWAEPIWLDNKWEMAYNQKQIFTLNSSNTEWEIDLCNMIRANLEKRYSISQTDNDRLLKHFFLIRTQILNVYTYKLVLAFAIDEEKTDAEHIDRWTKKKKEWWINYRDNLLQIYAIDYIGNILKKWAVYNSSAWNALDTLIKRITSNDNDSLATTKYSVFEWMNNPWDEIKRTDFGYKFQKLNFNLIDDWLIDKFDHWFPYNQMLIQATYRNWPFSYRDYYIYRSWA